jgi:CRP/FNR family transcriptional regulator, cyclic AMP receptor protein
MEADDRLSSLASLFGCTLPAAQQLDDLMSFVIYRHKDILIHQGGLCTKVWIVLDGWAQLQVIGGDGQVQLLAAHGPGELFGALPKERIFVCDVIAQDKLSVLEVSSTKLQALTRDNNQIANGLAMILARQYQALLDRMATRITLTAIGRVYAELLNQASDDNLIAPPPVVAALGLKAQTTRETASRAINNLLRRGIITRDARQLRIVSRSLLEDMAI